MLPRCRSCRCNCRYVGGSPAAAVEHLRPGSHLDETNSAVKVGAGAYDSCPILHAWFDAMCEDLARPNMACTRQGSAGRKSQGGHS